MKESNKRITIRFDRYPGVLEKLTKSATENCRSINNEVVYCIKEQLQFECEVKDWEDKT